MEPYSRPNTAPRTLSPSNPHPKAVDPKPPNPFKDPFKDPFRDPFKDPKSSLKLQLLKRSVHGARAGTRATDVHLGRRTFAGPWADNEEVQGLGFREEVFARTPQVPVKGL